MAEYTYVSQPFLPVYDKNSEILILGSLPSVKSREQGFYYGHPRNRFWSMWSIILQTEEPTTIDMKKQMLLSNHLALYDVIKACEIKGSSDSSIRKVIPANIEEIVRGSRVKTIFLNGRTAGKLFDKYLSNHFAGKVFVLPSTSPANAACSLQNLAAQWGEIYHQNSNQNN